MIMMQDGVEVYCLPDGACCEADEKIRSPLNVEECPLGFEECTGDCVHYAENYERPDWCPVQEMPEKKDIAPLASESWVSGWNDCVDTINPQN